MDVRGSARDRHERIGDGHIGEDAFRDLLHHPVTDGVPVVLETPASGSFEGTCLPLLKKLRDG
jgi:deoxyribonuclease-4